MVERLEFGAKVALGGALAVVFGAFLPWGPAGVAAGFEGNGLFTMVFALLAAGFIARSDWERDTHLAVVGLGALTAMIALVALPNPNALVDPGPGIYLTVAGGAVLAAGGTLGYATGSDHDAIAGPAD